MAAGLPLELIDEPVELGELLAHTLGAVAQAQSALDEATARRVEAFRSKPAGEFAVPPLWHVFTEVQLEVVLSASVAKIHSADGMDEAHLFSRTLSPTSVGLYGYQAAAGLTLRISMVPRTGSPSESGIDGEEPGKP